METKPYADSSKWIITISAILILSGLYFTTLYSFFLFHSIVEVFIIVVACGVFMVAWHSRRFLDNNYLLFIGIAYLFISILELIHTLAYSGMGIFRGYGANLPTQLWIAARYLESLSLLIAPLFFGRRIRLNLLFFVYASAICLIFLSIFLWNIFPTCFVEGTGLTPFKKISEYIICLIYMGSIVLLFQNRKEFEKNVYRLLISSILLSIGAELAFTFYVHVYGLSNLIGHYFTLISFYFIYKAIIETGLVKPYDLLFRNLKLSESIAKNERDKARKYLDIAGVITVAINADQTVGLINKKGCEILGYKESEIIGKNWFDNFLPGKDREQTRTVFSDLIAGRGEKVEYYENPVLTKDNKERLIAWHNSILRDDGGKIIVRLGSGEDITDQRKIEAALKESEQRFRTVADFANDWEYWVRPDGSHVHASPSCKRITGYGPDDFINNPGLMMEIIHPDDRAIFTNHKHIVDEAGEISPIEFRIITKDGDERWIEHICQVVYDTRGQHLGQRGSNRDITEQKKLQEQVLKARKLESLGTLAGGIAHDLNNLLFAVMGNISLAEDDLRPETGTYESLKEAEQACVRAKELSARLITFSKGGDPVKKMISINDLLKDTVISALSGSKIKPAISISDDIRQARIDEGQIKQVVRNIVVNAKEAMDDNGQLTVSCENIDIAEEGYLTLNQGQYIKISFKDQGCGISKDNLEKIFDPYFSTKDMGADKGQGLGLTVSYSIVQKHGGLINVESEPGTGSIFSVYLPAFRVKEPDLQKPKEKPAAQKPVKQPVIGTGKILLMDDEQAIRTLLGRVLNSLGYDFETCIEGKEAIEIYKKAMESKEPFDVVILDLTSKIGMGGQETMKRLLEIDPGVKGIIITGYSDDPVVANFRAYGFSGSLTKPTTRDELSKVINEVVSRGQ